MKWIVLAFLYIGIRDFVDTLFKLIEYIFKYCKERRTNMAKQKELNIFEQVEAYLIPNAKASNCKGETYRLTQQTMNGYHIEISLVADDGERLLDILEG